MSTKEDELVEYLDWFGQADVLTVALRGNDPDTPPTQQTYETIAKVEARGVASRTLIYDAVLAAKRCLADRRVLEGIFRITAQSGSARIHYKHFRLP